MSEIALNIKCIGFATPDAANVAAKRVSEVIEESAREMEITLVGLDGVTIAHDYDRALAELDRGYETKQALTRTNDAVASGIAMAPLVRRNGQIMTHLIMSVAVVPLIDNPTLGVSGRYILAHELAHAHEHYWRNKGIPNVLLQHTISAADGRVLYEIAEACWGEYVACFFSASIHPDQTFGSKSDWEMLRARGTSDEEIVGLWTKHSVTMARLGLFLSCSLMISATLFLFSFVVMHDIGQQGITKTQDT